MEHYKNLIILECNEVKNNFEYQRAVNELLNKNNIIWNCDSDKIILVMENSECLAMCSLKFMVNIITCNSIFFNGYNYNSIINIIIEYITMVIQKFISNVNLANEVGFKLYYYVPFSVLSDYGKHTIITNKSILNEPLTKFNMYEYKYTFLFDINYIPKK